jgi:molybdopterin-guanine dinucleotide biosynthesis protein A
MLSLALLSGGKSGRMGQDKALMPFLGRPLILRILERLAPFADEVILTVNHPAEFAFLGLPLHTDILPDRGALGGLYTSLSLAKSPLVAVVACDLPFANLSLFEHERDVLIESEADLVIPSTSIGLEPLHAVYRRETCLPIIESALKAGNLKLIGWFKEVKAREIPPEEISRFDPHGLAFWNVNTAGRRSAAWFPGAVIAPARARQAQYFSIHMHFPPVDDLLPTMSTF